MIEYLQAQGPEPSSFSPSFGPLVAPRDVLMMNPASGVDAYDRAALQSLTVMARYVTEFLTSPHAQLGRAGAVCPFTAAALDQDLIRLTASSIEAPDEAAVAAGMERLLGRLDQLDAGHRAIVAVFPRLTEAAGSELVDRVQKALKPAFVARELMIGQFYPSCPEPGLWNAEFRPLQTPVVSLAIRDITVYDAPFMLERQEYVDAFVRLFGEAGEARVAKARLAKARTGRERAAACPHHAARPAEPMAEARA